jgi:hypothetical protein
MSTATVHPSFIALFEEFLNFLKTKIEPAVAVAEKIAPVAEAIDPALVGPVTAVEAVIAGVEGVVNKL